MKQLLLFAFLSLALSLGAQTSVKRYVLIEHFTNSKCPICANKNPAFYNTLSQNDGDIHHVAIHPSVPYNTCVFYLANTTHNNSWAATYGIQGTPRVALNGTLVPAAAVLMPQSVLDPFLNQTSPLHVQVTENKAGQNIQVSVRVRTLSPIGADSLRLFVALAEKTVNQLTSNGESVHHDVFRTFLTPVTGVSFAPVGAQDFSYSFNIPGTWNADEIFATAFVKDANDEVLNSGTRFDPLFTSTDAPAETAALQLAPNPASETLRLSPISPEARIEIWNAAGSLALVNQSTQAGSTILNISMLQPGIYTVRVREKNTLRIGRFIKQ